MVNQHYYRLQRYAGTQSRHICPECGGKRCFTLYVDEQGNPLHEIVGRCDHESSCGYNYTPKDYFRDHPEAKSQRDWREWNPRPSQIETPLCTIPQEFVTRSIKLDYDSSLTQYLSTIIDPLVLEGVILEYHIGVTKAREVIYFQIDMQGRCRTGKIMKYDPATGHRIKDENIPSKINWVHSILKHKGVLPQSWTLTQCIFGEHLLSKYPNQKVALVESEKTAIICTALMPSYIWLATGGKAQLGDKLNVLHGREVIAFPDIDGFEEWQRKLSSIGGLNIRISDYLQRNATQEDRDAHIDIADILLREKSLVKVTQEHKRENPILRYFSPQYHQNVQFLMDELDLTPVSIKQMP